MTSDAPTPPDEIPTVVVDALAESSLQEIRQISRYAEALAEFREREARLEEEPEDPQQGDDGPDDLPQTVPSKATITVKEINGNKYYYWQWRDGDKIRSKYKGPVNPSE